MLDLKTATHQDFAACVTQTFTIMDGPGESVPAEPVRLDLAEVGTRGGFDPARQARQGFTLLFHGPLEPVLQQRIHRVSNESLGELELFLVPVGCEADGMRYEAVFA